MTVEEKIKGRKIGIIGMARSGIAAALLADSFAGHPFVSDNRDQSHLTSEVTRLQQANIPFETGGHSDKLLKCDYLVTSPGVPLTADIIKKANKRGIPVFSEIEFASWACKGKVIAITGSNGKTTTTTLMGEIFASAGLKTFVGGNIGLPFSEIAGQVPKDGYAIIEVSNFQLETIADFKPDTAMILNLTPDHLDRHGTFENYKKAKYRITENQTIKNCLVLNLDDPEIDLVTMKSKAELKYFTLKDDTAADAYVRENQMIVRNFGEHQVIDIDKIMIPGPHNLQNALAAAVVATHYGIKPEVIATVLQKFPGVEHRIEQVTKVAGINFVNDSKATNVDSVCFAVRSVEKGIYLIAGGRDKGGDFTRIAEYGKGKIKGIIAIGEAKQIIFDHLGQSFPVQFSDSLENAVNTAFEMAIPGDTVLLSPGCASFDMFDNFEQRGRVFKEAVQQLKKSKNGNESLAQK